MKRSFSVTLVAVVVLIGSLLFLLLDTIATIGLWLSANPGIRPEAKIGAIVGVSMLLFFSTWAALTGIGLFLLKRWARMSIIALGLLLVLCGLSAGVSVLVVRMPASPAGNAASSVAAVKMIMSSIFGLMTAVGIWWVVLFNSKSVKNQFSKGDSSSEEKPVSISIIAYLFILGCLGLPLDLYFRWPVLLFGHVFVGKMAVGVFAIIAMVQLYIAVGLLNLNSRSRALAILYLAFSLVSMDLHFVLPGRDERIMAFLSAMPHFGQVMPPPMPLYFEPMFFISAAIILAQIYFLVRNKAAFDPSMPEISEV